MLSKFAIVVGAMCSVCLMSSRLPTSALVIDVSLSDAVPSASRLSAAKIGAGGQRRHQRRQVPEGGEDVVAVVAEHGQRLGQLDDGVADGGALPAQVIGSGVDERTQRAHAA